MKTKARKLPHRVHRVQTLRNAEHFREHKKGIPEWLKNSDDSYIRHEDNTNRDLTNAPIILNITKKEVCCLDFGGAISEKIIEYLPHYGSPDAATHGQHLKSKSVSGGHGSGGKYYALSQFKECKIINYYLGKLTILRINKEAEYVDIEDEKISPWEAIRETGIDKWEYFDKEGVDIFKKINEGKLSFFCWRGIEPKDKSPISNKRRLLLLLSSISNHLQSRSALKSRKVDALINGRLLWPNIKPDEPEKDEDFGVREFALPNKLKEYNFNKYFNSALKISLSKKPLTGEKSAFNILEINANEKNIAYYDIPSFMMDKGISKSLIVYIDCPELKKDYNKVSEDRVHLIGGGITDLFLSWCRSKIQEVLDELNNKEKQKEEKEHLNELRNFLDVITEEISDLLEEDNIIKPVFSESGEEKSVVKVKTDKEGYGKDGKRNRGGDGKRKGGEEEKEEKTDYKKGKNQLKILISNKDKHPATGEIYNMNEHHPVLDQRTIDIDYGIWWINSQKRYIKKIDIRSPTSYPFYFFLVKEIIMSHRLRRLFKEQSQPDVDTIERMDFELIDEIFNKVVERLGIDLNTRKSNAEKIREVIQNKKKFTIAEIATETGTDITAIHVFLKNPGNHIEENYKIEKEKIGGRKGNNEINVYVRK